MQGGRTLGRSVDETAQVRSIGRPAPDLNPGAVGGGRSRTRRGHHRGDSGSRTRRRSLVMPHPSGDPGGKLAGPIQVAAVGVPLVDAAKQPQRPP